MQTMVRKFHRAFEKIVEDYLPSRDRQLSNSEMMLEIQVLWAKLAKAGNLHLTQSIDTEDSWIVNFSVTTMAPATCGLTIATLTSAQMFATLEDYRTGWQAMIEEPLNHCLPVGEVTFLPPELCFRELLSSSAPQWETLDLVRSRAKRAGLRTEAGNDGASDYPLEMYGLMYLLAILISDLRCHKKISKNAPQQLQRKARQAQTVPWLDGASLAVLREFLQG